MCPRGFLENHTLFQTIMSEIYTRFQNKTAQKPHPLERQVPISFFYNLTELFLAKFKTFTFFD